VFNADNNAYSSARKEGDLNPMVSTLATEHVNLEVLAKNWRNNFIHQCESKVDRNINAIKCITAVFIQGVLFWMLFQELSNYLVPSNVDGNVQHIPLINITLPSKSSHQATAQYTLVRCRSIGSAYSAAWLAPVEWLLKTKYPNPSNNKLEGHSFNMFETSNGMSYKIEAPNDKK
jgi:hypothetical protein